MAPAKITPRIVPFRAASQQQTAVSRPLSLETTDDPRRDNQFLASEVPIVSRGYSTTLQHLGGDHVLVYPLFVRVEHVSGEFVAISQDLAITGCGETELDALDDLRSGVSELFAFLQETRAQLSPYLLAQLRFLERLAGK